MEHLTNLGVGVATEATTSFLAAIKKRIGYLNKYQENLKSLKDAENKLDAKRNDARRSAEDIKRKQKDISSTAALWQSEVDKLHQKAHKMISDDNISNLHLWSRYVTSKHAFELAQEIRKQIDTAPDFSISFDPPATKLGDKFDLTGFMEFESRTSVVNQVWEALKDEKLRMCSLCGMGGMGKTTLVKKLVQRVERDHVFDMVAMATVSQNPDLRKIRGDIVSSLGWKFQSEELETSCKLIECLVNSDKSILLILDDIWEKLDFEAIGIPKARLKILLTSRKEDVCQRMGSESNFVINVLTGEEAWAMFKEITRESIEKWKLHDLARKIVDECGGLPIVIVTLAGALKYETKATWNDSLLKLQNSNLLGISGMEEVYSRFQLSYNLLRDKEVQSCFRLCCLFPEDHNILVEHLVWFGKGLQLFENVKSMRETRNRVESIISKLKKSFFLLDGEEGGTVKMHDILRDFAISISSKDKHPYIVGCENVMDEWPESNQYENCSVISIMCGKIKEHPVDLKCPKLELLMLTSSLDDDQIGVPNALFGGMKELKVLIVEITLLVQSLSTLRKLRTLVISGNPRSWDENEVPKIGDLLGHGDLKNLEILVFDSARLCHDFPKEIGLLCNLRCLRFGEVEFKYMPPCVLSKLVKLEELELSMEFTRWGCKENGGERVNAALDEIEFLPLTTLKIRIAKDSILAKKLVKSLARFVVCMGRYDGKRYNSDALLEVVDVDASNVQLGWMSGLCKKCESLILIEVRNLKSIMCLQSSELDNGFPLLKDLYFEECNEMEYLVDTRTEHVPSTFLSRLNSLTLLNMVSIKQILCDPYLSKTEPICFSNLSDVKIYRCPKLKHLFPLSLARELRRIHIDGCAEMEKIFYGNEVDRSIVVFPQLRTLKLEYLPKLRVLYDGKDTIEMPSLEEFTITRLYNMETFSFGSFKAPRLKEIEIGYTKYATSTTTDEDLNSSVKKIANHQKAARNRKRNPGVMMLEKNDNDN